MGGQAVGPDEEGEPADGTPRVKRPPGERPAMITVLATGTGLPMDAVGWLVLVASLAITAGWLLRLYR